MSPFNTQPSHLESEVARFPQELGLLRTPANENIEKLTTAQRAHPFLRALEFLQAGSLSLEMPGNIKLFYKGLKRGPHGHMRFHDWKCLDRLLTSGDLAWGEDYALGLWETNDISSLMHFVAENAATLEKFSNGNAVFRFMNRFRRKLFGNSQARSRFNSHEHYDLGNDFYSLWLDETMTYSGGLFDGNKTLPLVQAQKAKYERILDRLKPRPEDHILEIGCGWGGFMKAASERGARVTGLTLSEEQALWIEQTLDTKSMETPFRVKLEDYRKVKGKYDHIVSIGTFEHVGEAYWGTFMKCLHDRLKQKGQAVVQTITVREDLFDFYRSSTGFIREHIFPGGMLPTTTRFQEEARKAGFKVLDVYPFGQDYAITLEKWLLNFDRSIEAVRELGYNDTFIRKWRFYLAYCMAMFRASRISVMQVHLQKL